MKLPAQLPAIQPIGVIRSPFKSPEDMPIQPPAAKGTVGTIELLPELVPGLQDLEGFSHLWLIYHFHRAVEVRLVVTPFLDDRPHGIFATRAPLRPNPLGLSLVELLEIDGGQLRIAGVDVLDGTPLLDIKPYVPAFDQALEPRVGWLERQEGRVEEARSDGRFTTATAAPLVPPRDSE